MLLTKSSRMSPSFCLYEFGPGPSRIFFDLSTSIECICRCRGRVRRITIVDFVHSKGGQCRRGSWVLFGCWKGWGKRNPNCFAGGTPVRDSQPSLCCPAENFRSPRPAHGDEMETARGCYRYSAGQTPPCERSQISGRWTGDARHSGGG